MAELEPWQKLTPEQLKAMIGWRSYPKITPTLELFVVAARAVQRMKRRKGQGAAP